MALKEIKISFFYTTSISLSWERGRGKLGCSGKCRYTDPCPDWGGSPVSPGHAEEQLGADIQWVTNSDNSKINCQSLISFLTGTSDRLQRLAATYNMIYKMFADLFLQMKMWFFRKIFSFLIETWTFPTKLCFLILPLFSLFVLILCVLKILYFHYILFSFLFQNSFFSLQMWNWKKTKNRRRNWSQSRKIIFILFLPNQSFY